VTATVHLICGSTGAGKTTHALKMVREGGGVHFSIDDWTVRLFGPDQPSRSQWSWIAERVTRCEALIFDQAVEIGRQGVSSMLDLAFLRTDRREAIAGQAMAAGLGVRLHFLDVPAEERWRRVCARNQAQGETYRVTVTRPMFDFIESIWQPPTAAEIVALNGLRLQESV
jgi:predicted kinase